MKTSQNEALRKRMAASWVSPIEALEVGCMRLAARVHDLRMDGCNVVSRWADGDNGKRWKEYRIMGN